MNKLLLIFCTIICCAKAVAQTHEPWVRYSDESDSDKVRYGHKDLHGNIKVPARFEDLTADTFHNIIAVNDSTYKNYYLLKGGRRLGVDSVYNLYDNCEQEGMIRFNEPRSQLVGFFDSNGKVVIPAIYDDATSFNNGLSLVHMNGKRLDPDNFWSEVYWSGKGGKYALINKENKIVIDSCNARLLQKLNWYSMTTAKVANTGIYTQIKGVGGTTYSFINYNKEFTQWYNQVFLSALLRNDISELQGCLFNIVYYWKDPATREDNSPTGFMEKYNVILKQRMEMKGRRTRIWRFLDFNNDNPVFLQYHTSCGTYFNEKYPLFFVCNFSRNDKDHEHDNILTFIRTENGYKLLEVMLDLMPPVKPHILFSPPVIKKDEEVK